VPFLASGNLGGRLAVRDGFAVLSEQMQTSIPGLFMTSMMAAHDMGPFFAFTVSARTAARVIGAAVGRV
jgi:thioredoxin reductase